LTLVGTQRIQSDEDLAVGSGTTILHTIPVLSGCGAFFDYCVTESGGSKRFGTVMATWDNSLASWTDTSTPDLNGSTIGIGFTVTVQGGINPLVEFNSVVTSGTWDIKLAIRIIY
jgi:hypothetical protein